ncbi:MAG: ABC transporter ATP-binding protein, partial [Clostridia bacterium]|nr:ABC transporter ATP-binding protein [Clostridia bacterium]
KAANGFATNIRKDMFEHIQTFSFSNIDKFSHASLVTRLTTDVNSVQMAYMMIIRIAIRAPLMLIFGVTMTVYAGGALAGIFALVIPILIVGLLLIFKFAHPLFKTLFKKYDRMNTVVEENIRGMRVVKSTVREDAEIKKFNQASNDIYKTFSKAERIVAFASPLMQLAMYLSITLISWFGANLVISSNGQALNQSQLTMIITYSSQILMSLMMLSMIYINVTMSKASIDRINEVLNETPEIKNPENPVYKAVNGQIDFENVSFSYKGEGGVYCLKDVNLHVKSGQTVGIIGATGSSKTTLVQLLPRLYDATVGTVKIGGVDVKDYDLDTLRSAVAMVLQKNVLFSGTIRDNMKWGKPDATDEEINNALKLACAYDFVQGLGGLDTHIEQGGSNVSGGQKQRLCIARALIANPKIIVLDDSTSAVDMNTDLLIRKAFKEYIPETTKLIIAQRVVSVMDADLIIVMDNGEVVAQGTHTELMDTCEIYREVYETQQSGGDFDGEN